METGFLDKLIARLDRLDPESLQSHFLRLARERGLLETIFQSIQEGVIVIDGDGKVSYANRAAEYLMGFDLKSVKGRPVAKYLQDIDWDRVLELDESAWSKLVSREIEITYPQHKYLSFYVVPLSSGTGQEPGAVVMLRDITHEREQEASMVESERLKAVKLLAAGVAHEIGNPLNALTIHLQLLDRELRKLPEPQGEGLSELVDVARTEVSRLDLIITQFLRAIRPTKPKLVLCRADALLKETLALLKQDIQNRNIEVELDSAETVPKVPVDRDQMKQAFFNVIKNALQAMPDGGSLRIVLSLTSRFLAASFKDTGVGIKPEDFSRIFEPYHTTKQEGTGLGMMIVQRIVQDHGGQIEVQSKADAGTNITILLPLAERRVRLLKAGKEKTGDTGS